MEKIWKPVIVSIALAFAVGIGFVIYQNFSRPLPLPNSPTSTDKLVEIHLIGGFTGFCDHLVVYRDGSATILNDCANKQKDFQVKPEALNQLITLSQQLSQFSYESKDDANNPDSLSTKLIFYGQGSNQPEQEQKNTIIQLVNSILVQNRP